METGQHVSSADARGLLLVKGRHDDTDDFSVHVSFIAMHYFGIAFR